jgi:hypothetical protein
MKTTSVIRLIDEEGEDDEVAIQVDCCRHAYNRVCWPDYSKRFRWRRSSQ